MCCVLAHPKPDRERAQRGDDRVLVTVSEGRRHGQVLEGAPRLRTYGAANVSGGGPDDDRAIVDSCGGSATGSAFRAVGQLRGDPIAARHRGRPQDRGRRRVVLDGRRVRFDVAHTSSYVDADRPFNPSCRRTTQHAELVITPGDAGAYRVTYRYEERDEFHMRRRRRLIGAEGLRLVHEPRT